MEQEESTRTPSTRRGFLQNAVGAGVVVASGGLASAAFGDLSGFGPLEAHAQDVLTIINLTATGEALAATLYHAVITRATFHIDEMARLSFQHMIASDLHHYDVLQSLGGQTLTRQFYLPRRLLSDASVFAQTSLTLETAIVGAYVAATHHFAVLGRPSLAATAARQGANAAQHQSLIGHLAGLPYAYTPAATDSGKTSDLASVIEPFLTNGRDMMGPLRCPSRGRPAQG